MDTTPLWKAITQKTVIYPELSQTIEADVAIIGGGITGITAALQLVNSGKKVVILEANRIGNGTTGFSTGNLYIAVQPYYQNIVKKFDEEVAKKIAHSRKFAIDFIEKTVQEKNINCNFSRRPWFIYTDEQSKINFLEKEVEAIKRMGIAIDYTGQLPLALKFKKAALMENQARFNPLEYVIGVASDLQKKSCQIFENTRVIHIEEKEICTITTLNGRVKAQKVLIATHTPIGFNPVQMFTAPYRSYVVAAELEDGVYPEGHFWDLAEPHHVTCTQAVSNNNQPALLIVSGSHHKTGQSKDMSMHYDMLETFLRDHFAISNIAYRWSAQHYHSADDIPYIGFAERSAKHRYIATGYFADGLVYGTLAGILISDLILEKENPLEEIYQANRFKPLASGAFLAKEGTNVFLQYLKDYSSWKTKDYEDIPVGEGRVVNIDKEKCAVSRDQNNELHIVSAVCTHMKCIVHWNDAEETWDCPCHGSRFTRDGKIIEGPAEKDLEKK